MQTQEQRKRTQEPEKLLSDISKEQEEFLAQPPPKKEQDDERLKRLLATQKDLYTRAQKPITFSAPLVRIDEMPFIYPNTIAIISAKTGLHKSRLAEIIASSLLSKNQDPAKCLGLIAERECEVLLIDTERNISEQLPYAIQCISRLTHGSAFDTPKNLHCISILEEPREDRSSALKEFLEYRRGNATQHFVAIIDVLTDICVNFNDPRDTMPLIDTLNKTINTTNCTFIAVIHQNPSKFDDKARGHLGTEIENKASTIITLSTKDDYISVECKKQRSAKKFNTFYARFDESQKTLVRLSKSESDKIAMSEEKHIEWKDVFEKSSSLSRKELIERLVEMEYAPSKATAERRIEEAKKGEEIVKGDGKQGKYSLPEMLPITENLPFD